MKIAFLSDDFPPSSFGGAGISTSELALGVKSAGHEVFVITTVRKQSDVEEADYHGLKVYKIQSDYPERWRAYRGLYNRPVIKRLEEILKEIEPDVIHVNNIHYYLSYHSLKIAKKYSKALIMTFRDTMPFTYGKLETNKYIDNFDCRVTWLDNLWQAKKRWNPFRNFIIKKYLKYPDQLLSVSDALRQALDQNDIKGLETLHTGADIARWQSSPEEISSFKIRYGLHGKKIIFFGGRLSDSKGARKALEAISLVAKEDSSAVLLVAGSTGGYAEQAKKLEIEENLRFTGWISRDEIRISYASSDMILVPSIYLDPFPRVAIEASASSKPVIATSYGGAKELVLDGKTGYVVNPFNTRYMAEKIIELLKDPGRARRFGEMGCERIKTHFNLNDKIAQLISIYEKLA